MGIMACSKGGTRRGNVITAWVFRVLRLTSRRHDEIMENTALNQLYTGAPLCPIHLVSIPFEIPPSVGLLAPRAIPL